MPETVRQILDRLYPKGYMGRSGIVYTDTSDFMRITGGDVIVLDDQSIIWCCGMRWSAASGSKTPNTGSSGAAIRLGQ